MITISSLKNAHVGVFGLGVSGLATCEALIASGAHVYSWDENKAAREKTANTEYRCEHPKQWPWDAMEYVVVSPGVPLTHPKPHAIVRKARASNIPVVGDVELFARAIAEIEESERPRIVAVTGSNGKSTTSALIAHILRSVGENAQLGGNIGEAVLSLAAPVSSTIYVLELSSFQLDLTYSLAADVSVLLNITPDHIDRHGTLGAYVEAKKRIFRNQSPSNLAVLGVDDEYSEAICTALKAAGAQGIAPISAQSTLGEGAYALGGSLYYNLDGKTIEAGELSGAKALCGSHNHQNASAALVTCQKLGVAPAVSVNAMERFEGLPHRMEIIAVEGYPNFINDSKATNAGAAMRALAAFDDVFWIAGGRAKSDGAIPLRNSLGNVRRAYLFGEAADLFAQQLEGLVSIVLCENLDVAIQNALTDATASDAKQPVILFSPACASYDQYRNFEERGDAFRACVEELVFQNGAAA